MQTESNMSESAKHRESSVTFNLASARLLHEKSAATSAESGISANSGISGKGGFGEVAPFAVAAIALLREVRLS